jgi:hypothetical protein
MPAAALAAAAAPAPAAGLAAAAAPAPAAGLVCACGCGQPVVVSPRWPAGGRKRFATLACAKRQARRDERRQLRELKAAAAVAVAAAPEPARRLVTAASVSEPCRIFAAVG